MTKILIIGTAPGHLRTRGRAEARGYRTWQLTEPLISKQHDVYLIGDNSFEDISKQQNNFHFESYNLLSNLKRVKKACSRFKPDCIIGAAFLGSLVAASINYNVPTWMDIYGDPITQDQLRMWGINSIRGQLTVIGFEEMILTKGDIFSTCSTPQKYALIGKLSRMERLVPRALGYDFVYAMLPGGKLVKNKPNEKIVRGKRVNDDAFIVLWTGGYNLWADVHTLVRALEIAMDDNKTIKYVSVGGPVVNKNQYDQFVTLVDKSRHKERFIVLDWLPHSQMDALCAESDVGITTNSNCYEILLGNKTNQIAMISAGLPVITSDGCELSQLLDKLGAAISVPIGDYNQLARAILQVANNRKLREEMSQKGLKVVEKELSFDATVKPLLSWVQRPAFAPDKYKRNFLTSLENRLRCAIRKIQLRLLLKIKPK